MSSFYVTYYAVVFSILIIFFLFRLFLKESKKIKENNVNKKLEEEINSLSSKEHYENLIQNTKKDEVVKINFEDAMYILKHHSKKSVVSESGVVHILLSEKKSLFEESENLEKTINTNKQIQTENQIEKNQIEKFDVYVSDENVAINNLSKNERALVVDNNVFVTTNEENKTQKVETEINLEKIDMSSFDIEEFDIIYSKVKNDILKKQQQKLDDKLDEVVAVENFLNSDKAALENLINSTSKYKENKVHDNEVENSEILNVLEVKNAKQVSESLLSANSKKQKFEKSNSNNEEFEIDEFVDEQNYKENQIQADSQEESEIFVKDANTKIKEIVKKYLSENETSADFFYLIFKNTSENYLFIEDEEININSDILLKNLFEHIFNIDYNQFKTLQTAKRYFLIYELLNSINLHSKRFFDCTFRISKMNNKHVCVRKYIVNNDLKIDVVTLPRTRDLNFLISNNSL